MRQEDRLWRIWWLWGIPMAWATSALVLGAEAFREADLHSAGNLLDVVRLAVYWQWCRLAWRCSRNVANPLWTPLARSALAAGLVATALT